MLPKRAYPPQAALHRIQPGANVLTHFSAIASAEMRHDVAFQVLLNVPNATQFMAMRQHRSATPESSIETMICHYRTATLLSPIDSCASRTELHICYARRSVRTVATRHSNRCSRAAARCAPDLSWITALIPINIYVVMTFHTTFASSLKNTPNSMTSAPEICSGGLQIPRIAIFSIPADSARRTQRASGSRSVRTLGPIRRDPQRFSAVAARLACSAA